MSATSLTYWSEKLGRSQVRSVELYYEITAAKTVVPFQQGYPAQVFFDALSTQSEIDEFFDDQANEFLLAAFDATSMGLDAFGGLVNMANQVDELSHVRATVFSGAGLATVNEVFAKSSSSLTASTLQTECAKSVNGNIAFKCELTGLDALTAGVIKIELGWLAK